MWYYYINQYNGYDEEWYGEEHLRELMVGANQYAAYLCSLTSEPEA